MELWIIWLIVAVTLLLIEIPTQMLWALCLGVGSLGSMIVALIGASLTWQIIAMAIVGLIAFLALLPLYKRWHRKKAPKMERTGMDALLGRRAIVTHEVAPGHLGRARIDGDNWQVCAENPSAVLPRGTEVEVVSYDSIVLTVREISRPENIM